MILSTIISLTPTSNVPIFGALGRPVQAWFLNQIMLSNPSLAQNLHDSNGSKPFTVSTLLDHYGHPLEAGARLAAGQECWLRVTTIGKELSGTMLERVLQKLPKKLTLYKMDFRIDGYTHNQFEHPWAGLSSFADMAQDSRNVRIPRSIRMEFVAPTAFRSSGNDIALPIPGQVFRSLWQKWNVFCPEPMQVDDHWPGFAEDCILVNELTGINTERWTFAEGTRGSAIGFTGTVGFTLLPKLKVKEAWQPFWDGADVVLQSLAQFAFYSGVGHHSTIGMGQAKPITSPYEQAPQRKRNNS